MKVHITIIEQSGELTEKYSRLPGSTPALCCKYVAMYRYPAPTGNYLTNASVNWHTILVGADKRDNAIRGLLMAIRNNNEDLNRTSIEDVIEEL